MIAPPIENVEDEVIDAGLCTVAEFYIIRAIQRGVPAKTAFGACGWSRDGYMADTMAKKGLKYWGRIGEAVIPWKRVEERARLWAEAPAKDDGPPWPRWSVDSETGGVSTDKLGRITVKITSKIRYLGTVMHRLQGPTSAASCKAFVDHLNALKHVPYDKPRVLCVADGISLNSLPWQSATLPMEVENVDR